MELGQALEQVLGTDGVEELSLEDWNVMHHLTFGIDLAEQVLPLTADTGGDEAAGSPATSVASAPCEMGALSSPEDELPTGRSPLGEGTGAKPANKVTRRRRHGLRRLTRGVRDMAINVDHVEISEKGPGQTPGPVGAILARSGQSTTTRSGSRPPVPPAIRPEDVRREMQGGGDIPMGGAPPGGGGDGWGPHGGGGGGDGGDNPDKDASMAKEPEDEDPMVGH